MRRAELLRYLVLAAQREGNLRLARELRGPTLTSSQAELLRVLADREPLTPTGLGELLTCESGTNPSRLVDRLDAASAELDLGPTIDLMRRLVDGQPSAAALERREGL